MTATGKHGLGRGLGALLSDRSTHSAHVTPVVSSDKAIRRVSVTQIRKSPWQPRRVFRDEALEDLTRSVKDRGILQPLLVRPFGDGFELIAGERRLRAAIAAELKEVPVIVVSAADIDALQLALVENLQREDLNVIEEAEGYAMLAEKFNLTQEEIAARVGKARPTVANAMRLLALPTEVKQMLAEDALTPGHAKILTGVSGAPEQLSLARRVVTEGLNVRQLEKLMRQTPRARKKKTSESSLPTSHLSYISDKLHAHFGTSIRLTPCRTLANGKKARGTLEIDFYSNEDLDRILSQMGLAEDL